MSHIDFMQEPLYFSWLVVDESGGLYGSFTCDGLAYEWIDSLQDKYPNKQFHIERIVNKRVEDV